MNLVELSRALRQLRLSGMTETLETRLLQAQTEKLVHLDFLSVLVDDELERRRSRFLDRRVKKAQFRDHAKTLDTFDFDFNKKMNRKLVFELASGRFVEEHQDALFLGPPGTGKSHLGQAIGHAVIKQNYRVIYREAHTLLEELADATLDGNRKKHLAELGSADLLIIDDLGMPPRVREVVASHRNPRPRPGRQRGVSKDRFREVFRSLQSPGCPTHGGPAWGFLLGALQGTRHRAVHAVSLAP